MKTIFLLLVAAALCGCAKNTELKRELATLKASIETGVNQNEFDACMASTTMQPSECELWWDCYVDKCMNGEMGGEFTAACFAQCDMDFGGQANLYGPMKTCICNECASECVPFCP